jgi:hypothetical protein
MSGTLIDVGDPKVECSGRSDHDRAAVLGFLVPIEERLERSGEGSCGEGMVLIFLATVGAASPSPLSVLSPARGSLLRFKVLDTDATRSGCVDCGAEAG